VSRSNYMCMQQQQRADEHESVTGIRTHSSTRTNGLVHLSKFTCDKPSITACMLVCLAVLMTMATTLIAWHAIELLLSSNVEHACMHAHVADGKQALAMVLMLCGGLQGCICKQTAGIC